MASKNFIGQRIRTMRLSRGMTQADLAKSIGQSQASITMYETGKREPDFETLEALADVFNVPMSSFVESDATIHPGGSSVESQSNEYVIRNPKIRILASRMDKLPVEQQEQALEVFNAMYHKFFDHMEDEKK